MLEVGRVCMKLAGREAGKYCVIVKKMDENFVMVTGPKELTSVKRRRCNVNHLEPLMDMLKIKSDAPDSEVLRAYQQDNLTRKLGLEKDSEKPAKKKTVTKKVETKIPSPKAAEKVAAPKKAVKKASKPKPKPKPAPKKAAKKPAKKKAAAKKKPAAKKAKAKKK